MSTSSDWKNWAGSVRRTAINLETPATIEELLALVSEAQRGQRKLRPVGSSHSFTGVGAPEDIQVDFSGFTEVLDVDTASNRVRVGSGITLANLNAVLDEHGLALPNLGDIDRQTIAGAIATGTHGTGARYQGLAAAVTGYQMVTATGEILEDCSPGAPALEAVQVSLGALGLLTQLTIEAVPAFPIEATEHVEPIEQVLESVQDEFDGHDHFEFFWFPHTDVALTKRNRRLDPGTPLKPLSTRRSFIEDELVGNGVFGLAVQSGIVAPRAIPLINRLAMRTQGMRTFTDKSYKVFASPRRVKFYEMEYGVPREHVVPVLRRIRDVIDTHDFSIAFPIEVRVAAADSAWLSMANGRDNAYIAVHVPRRTDPREYFFAVEEIVGDYQGRPHWGKMHSLTHHVLRERYPRFDDFVALRNSLDPAGMLTNRYLNRCLGPVPR